MEIQAFILEYLIDQFLLFRCQMKRYKQVYDIFE